MDYRESRKIQRVLRVLARQWNCPVWMVTRTVQEKIDRSWNCAQLDPQEKALWDQYFPNGKPTAEEYILWLGRAQENGEEMPYLLKVER